ncbi:hypothetical protein PWG71_09215 [Nocardiopsis sp. N85]|uniref:hypothetical protein n=1 Tax=Nocardiopsis sp. N85 TaxID=3029400 RepID=UPI00237F76BA|nr:hypothetical protein [Nocardiopsis sp. N85]MDE3721567.1 hypothetical protein [Nocardiopsis sp. N85]
MASGDRVDVFSPDRVRAATPVGVDGGTLYLPTPLGLTFVEPTDTESMWAVAGSLPRPLEAGDPLFTRPRTDAGWKTLREAGIDHTPAPGEAGTLPLLLLADDDGPERMPQPPINALSVHDPVSAARIRARARHSR